LSPRSDAVIAAMWLKANLRLFLRTPRAAFFTFVFPLVLLLVFNSTNNSNVTITGGKVPFAQFFTPSIAVFAMATTSFTGVIFGITTLRDEGVLKRVRGTPLPMSVFLGARLGTTLLTGLASVLLMFVVSVPAFGVHVYLRLLPAALVTLAVGGAAFCALALAVASFVRRAESAPVAANLTIFPLMLVSGVFYPVESEPDWLQRLAHIFPLSHFAQAVQACLSPHTQGSGFSANHLVALVLWGFAGAVVAVRRFNVEDEDGSRPSLLRGRLSAVAARGRP
jgi:ABC-2 type transport system permease protein